MFEALTYQHHCSLLLLHEHTPATVGPEKGRLRPTAHVDLRRARCVGDSLDTHRSSLQTVCELACDTTSEVDLKRPLRGEHVGYS
jgi:hypothetical protein